MTAIAESCISCGMPMPSPEQHAPGNPDSTYCKFCSTPDGELQTYDERLERLTQFTMREQNIDREVAATKARERMAAMPAWSNHTA